MPPRVALVVVAIGARTSLEPCWRRSHVWCGRHRPATSRVPVRTWDDLNDPAIVAIALATPARQHECMSVQALEAGKRVVVEKPLALTVAGVERVCGRREG
ncbi:hypothetical protein TOPH_02047 [Tolypocladium ophioglossoides CBS 100239]|uniref:Gfo/Idh/MocA-like oxidoreductase N-terminal domain-containing protein n=1 Tax=Tolypocladium ophioglossoides (strain CBS 100239) TaxID=1163406 RepID=A0A0L0NGE2_TOLOC|nr:hypothetical protein TOPH_02047 [Tolypocladium ophioglossoides CBS 100239]